VLRSESVTVKAGTFDAWVVEASAGPSQTTFWVAQGGPVVRVVATLPQAPARRSRRATRRGDVSAPRGFGRPQRAHSADGQTDG
jgi:hypothetical protein